VKAPRFRIGWLMVAVAIAALNFGAIRAICAATGQFFLSWVVGTLPMANVLAVGLLIAQQRPRYYPFLLGFEAFGAMALAFYIVSASDDFAAVAFYLKPCLDPIEDIIGPDQPFLLWPVLISACVVMLGLPQVVCAMVGGLLSHMLFTVVGSLLSRRFGIAITPRR
jgi:hypothetical protein